MEIISDFDQMRRLAQDWRTQGQRIALVPTMGYFHDGHLSLMRYGREAADRVVVSLFVNPTQFGPNEDLARYPRDLERDAALAREVGVDALYTPQMEAMYPPGFQTLVTVEDLSRPLCGASRPGHFRGVATVVLKLLLQVHPHLAVFGEKDYQQLQVISRLNDDLELGVEIVGMPTIREADGLAMSSRNSYLSTEERQRALAISKGLFAARDAAKGGEAEVSKLVATVRAELVRVQAREDYVELVDAKSLAPLTRLQKGVPARALVAAFVGTTRLIDNLAIELG